MNSSARGITKLRLVMLGAALAAVAGLEVYGGASLAAKTGQTTSCQNGSPFAPNVSISDLIAAAR